MFNWGLALVKAVMDQRTAEASYGVPADQLTPSLSWSAYRLRKLWNQVKDKKAPWWAENSKATGQLKAGWAELMIVMRRKTLIVCQPCHTTIHHPFDAQSDRDMTPESLVH